MMFENYKVILKSNKIQEHHKHFIEKWHYSGTARSQMSKYVFELIDDSSGEMLGVSIFGTPCGANVISAYGEGTIELRRLCLIDATPKNSESYFISKCLKMLKKEKVTKVISYSDPNVGHKGTIYRAANFEYLGKQKGSPRILQYKERSIHARIVYQKTKYGYVKSALKYQELIKSGEAKWKNLLPKDIFLYKIR